MSKLALTSWPSSSVFGDSWILDKAIDGLFAEFNPDRFLSTKLDYPVDISDSESETYIDIPLAGHKKEDIEVTVQDGYLSVTVKSSEKRKDVKYWKTGISQKTRKWKWDILNDYDSANVTSTFVDGLLSIVIPKLKKAEPEVRRIEIN